MSDLFIGLMSGTSADGIDAILVDLGQKRPRIVDTHYTPYETTLRDKILDLFQVGQNEIERMGEMDTLLGKEFAKAVKQLLGRQQLDARHIKAIGCHGQTIRHLPNKPHYFTLQIGNPNIIAAETGIVTVTDFRRKDLAHGGQGAPLVPAFHHYALHSDLENRAIINIGGIANITLVLKDKNAEIIGYDTGPGNVLMDVWTYKHHKNNHDMGGAWAAQGKVNSELLALMLADDYFKLPAPKSTGREYFNATWIEKYLAKLNSPVAPVDVQATLAELTARTILDAVQKHIAEGEMLICGGGTHNQYLMQRLKDLAPTGLTVATTEKHAIHPDWVEALAFAWLAKQTLLKQPGNVPNVTGALKAAVLGGIYYPE